MLKFSTLLLLFLSVHFFAVRGENTAGTCADGELGATRLYEEYEG
jgi:hypothetical protein